MWLLAWTGTKYGFLSRYLAWVDGVMRRGGSWLPRPSSSPDWDKAARVIAVGMSIVALVWFLYGASAILQQG